MSATDAPLLLTGASGTIGRILAPFLAAKGYPLRLSDIVAFPDPLPANAKFIPMDLADAAAVKAAAEGVRTILHFGGVNGEHSEPSIIPANVVGTANIFEAARLAGARVVFASSNHIVGFHPRGRTLTIADEFRPDGLYAVSKIYGEMLGRLYLSKHGVESIHLRIGSCLPRPVDRRQLSTWLSHGDLERLIIAAIEAVEPGFAVVWGISRNTRAWWEGDDAHRIGYSPEDDAEVYAPSIPPPSDELVAALYQGGGICAVGYTRPPPLRREGA